MCEVKNLDTVVLVSKPLSEEVADLDAAGEEVLEGEGAEKPAGDGGRCVQTPPPGAAAGRPAGPQAAGAPGGRRLRQNLRKVERRPPRQRRRGAVVGKHEGVHERHGQELGQEGEGRGGGGHQRPDGQVDVPGRKKTRIFVKL